MSARKTKHLRLPDDIQRRVTALQGEGVSEHHVLLTLITLGLNVAESNAVEQAPVRQGRPAKVREVEESRQPDWDV